jgi:hypothetical protein
MKPLLSSKVLPLAAATLLALALTGCGRDSVKVYKVDANDTTTPPAAGSGAMPTMMPGGVPVPDNSGLPKLKYTLPEGWKEKALTQLRVASFEITEGSKQADVSVIPLGGMAGGDFANVNRWRGQVGLSTITEAEVQKLAEKIEAAGQPADLYDIAGTSPGSGEESRILATILHREDMAWFFKMTGDGALVAKNKAAFIAFLKAVEFGAPSAPAAFEMNQQLPPSHPAIPGMEASQQLPPSHPAIPGMGMGGGAPVATPAAGDKPTWTIPTGWQEGPLAQFLVAKYVIVGAGEAKAEVNVSSLTGDGGGMLANINRWRGQLGQTPASEADIANLPTMDASGTKASIVEIAGTNPRTGKPAQLIGIVLPLGGQTWFYKLMGDAEVVAAQRDALVKFVQSAKYP